RRRVRHSPRRQQRKQNHTNSECVSRDRITTETRNDTHEADPACHADEYLKRRSRRQSNQTADDRRLDPKMMALDTETPTRTDELTECEERACASADCRRDRSADDAKLRKRSESKDQTR